MPTMTMGSQNGNSCAAHCIVISIAEMFGSQAYLSEAYAENSVWPAIRFRSNGDAVIDGLAKRQNSDPRNIVNFLKFFDGVEADLLFDDTSKTEALNFLDTLTGVGLGGLFKMISGGNTNKSINIMDNVYYNCSYLMFKGGDPHTATFDGMHNILVTRSNGEIWYYNPNESIPSWTKIVGGGNWRVLANQNGGAHSYVFTGVTVSTKLA